MIFLLEVVYHLEFKISIRNMLKCNFLYYIKKSVGLCAQKLFRGNVCKTSQIPPWAAKSFQFLLPQRKHRILQTYDLETHLFGCGTVAGGVFKKNTFLRFDMTDLQSQTIKAAIPLFKSGFVGGEYHLKEVSEFMVFQCSLAKVGETGSENAHTEIQLGAPQ